MEHQTVGIPHRPGGLMDFAGLFHKYVEVRYRYLLRIDINFNLCIVFSFYPASKPTPMFLMDTLLILALWHHLPSGITVHDRPAFWLVAGIYCFGLIYHQFNLCQLISESVPVYLLPMLENARANGPKRSGNPGFLACLLHQAASAFTFWYLTDDRFG